MDFQTILNFFASPEALIPLVVIVTEFIDARVAHWNGTLAYVRTVVVAAVLCTAGLLFHVGFFADVTGAYDIVGNYLVVILGATGLFQVPFMKALLEWAKIRVVKK